MLCRMATTASGFPSSGFTQGATGQAQAVAARAQADIRVADQIASAKCCSECTRSGTFVGGCDSPVRTGAVESSTTPTCEPALDREELVFLGLVGLGIDRAVEGQDAL